MPTPDRVPALAGDWVFFAVFRCQRCGREVTIRRDAGEAFDRPSYREVTICPSCARRG